MTIYLLWVMASWQLKEKKKQLFLKTTSEGRQRAKQKRFEEELERERQNQQDEEKRLYVAKFMKCFLTNLLGSFS